MRLIAITLGTLLLLGIAMLSVRFWGYGQYYQPYDHEFFKTQKPLVIVPWEQSFYLEKKPEMALLANVYRNDLSEILVMPAIEAFPDRTQKENPTRPLLLEFLKKFKNTRIVINILDNQKGIHEQIVKIIEDSGHDNKILIQSNYNVVMESIKKLKPVYVFGASLADIMRFKTFSSMGLVSAGPFKGDVYFAPLKAKNLDTLNDEIIKELERRHKPIYLGPLQSKAEVEQALRLGASGVLVDKPETAYP